MSKATSRFFSVKRRKNDYMLFIRGKQVATIFFEPSEASYWVNCVNTLKSAYDFKTFQEADDWAWRNYA